MDGRYPTLHVIFYFHLWSNEKYIVHRRGNKEKEEDKIKQTMNPKEKSRGSTNRFKKQIKN